MRFNLVSAFAISSLLAVGGVAHAAPACEPAALNALQVPGLTVTEAKAVAPTGQAPGHCAVTGTVVTQGEGAPEGLARFAMQLPNDWQQRFLFEGVGGNAGTLQASLNGVDRGLALGKGYTVALTDTGHLGDGTTAKWVRKPDGSLDQAKVTDFLFRAAHDVTVAGKAFAQAYYGAPIQHAYFDGCSTGGRMALAAAMHYPDDYQGVIAGDPAMDFNLNIARMAVQKAILSKPSGYISPELLNAVDARIVAQCDALDGAKDGLVQDPSRCPLKPEDLKCKAGQSGDCFSADQLAVFKAYVEPLRDSHGRVAYPGWPMAHLAGAQGASFTTFGRTAPNAANTQSPWGEDERTAPRGWRLGLEGLTMWLGYGESTTLMNADINVDRKVAGDELFKRTRAIMGAGEGWEASRLAPFFAKGGKLILYHGSSDPSITPVRSTMMYEDLVKAMKGLEKAQQSARYFLVPGMFHCGGGAGVEQFDTLDALEAWVEQGKAPAMIAAKSRPDAPVKRELPLCAWPQQARYDGKGALDAGSSWSCATVSKGK